MSNQTEKADAESVSSSESCAQADNEAEPTPGPWVARKRENGDYDVEDVPGAVSITGQVRSNTGAFSAEAKANAELIAAAPDLLQAVKACRSIAKKSVSPVHRLMAIAARLDEALDKYEGEAQPAHNVEAEVRWETEGKTTYDQHDLTMGVQAAATPTVSSSAELCGGLIAYTSTMNYDQWMHSLNEKAARYEMEFDPDNSAWRDCYENGDTPQRALDAHLEACESLAEA